jgi:hypothetical protein
LLAISILLEKFFIAPIFPWLGNFGSIRPSLVFLDIPLELPAIDLIPVSILFALFYQIAPSAGLSREHPSISSGARVWKALTGWWILLVLLLAGGGGFYLAQDLLPRSVSNGIDSFGVRADLTLPYPSGGLIHLHGSVVMLLTSALGLFILHRRTATPVPQPDLANAVVSTAHWQNIASPAVPQPRPEVLSSAVVSSAGTLIAPSINEVFAAQQQKPAAQQHQPIAQQPHARYQPPVTAAVVTAPAPKATTVANAPAPKQAEVATAPPEKKYKPVTILPGNAKPAIITPEPPPTCRLTTPPPIAVVMPRPAPGVGKMHPCYVIGGLKPVKIP